LDRIRQKVEKGNGNGKHAGVRGRNGKNGQN
jgi:hypothetical protein